jgi:phosphoribosylformylglycinamidine synthase
MGGNLGMTIDLGAVSVEDLNRNDKILFSESAGRFIVTIDPENTNRFEGMFRNLPCACIGNVTETPEVLIRGTDGTRIVRASVKDLKAAWKRPFGDLI